MSEYLLQEDGTSKFIKEDASGDLLKEFGETDPSFISSATAVHAPTLFYTGSVTLSIAGTYSWLCPAGVTTVQVFAYGGGGSGQDGHLFVNGSGGGGGAFSGRDSVPVTPGTMYTVVVGSGGTHGLPGTDGASSTFTGDSGVQVIAVGGGHGDTTGGAGGAASSCTGDTGLKFSGGSGATSIGVTGGGGGASGNPVAAGASGTGSGVGGVGANGGGSGGANNSSGASPGGGAGGGDAGGASGGNGSSGEIKIIIGVQFVMPTIASVTTVYTPTLTSSNVTVPLIASVTTVYPVVISSTDVRVPFLSSNTHVYQPTLKVAFTGAGVSQVALEVLTSGSDENAYVSQVTLEIIVPNYRGAHVWVKSGQTGG